MKKFHLDFKPSLTPPQMLKLGVFGGYYFGRILPKEFPPSWKNGYEISKLKDKEIDLNAFRVDSGLPLKAWQESGWIHEQDPLGWFQWYCRYYLGRRTEDDSRQIARWKAYTRHYNPVLKKGSGDLNIRRVQRQSLLHWAYDPAPDFKNLPDEKTFKKIRRLLKDNASWSSLRKL